jgi:hypothetical protein
MSVCLPYHHRAQALPYTLHRNNLGLGMGIWGIVCFRGVLGGRPSCLIVIHFGIELEFGAGLSLFA